MIISFFIPCKLQSPNQASIPAYGHFYATITFTPPAMQTYNTIFDVVIDLGLQQGVRIARMSS